MRAWYFSNEDKRLRYDDSREIAVGVTHAIDGEPKLCQRGLHASIKPLDALTYAPGPVVWLVRLGGKILTGDDKLCATERTYIAGGVDVSEMLRLFARQCALDVVHLWNAPNVVVQYLKTGDESLRDAAMDAAMDAARTAARGAAWAAAWGAARGAAWGAARDAAWAAAWGAARGAAWAAAWGAARGAAGGAARDAAWAAAWGAARGAQNSRFEAMLMDALKLKGVAE